MMLAASRKALSLTGTPGSVPWNMSCPFTERSQRNSTRLITFFHRSYCVVNVAAKILVIEVVKRCAHSQTCHRRCYRGSDVITGLVGTEARTPDRIVVAAHDAGIRS